MWVAAEKGYGLDVASQTQIVDITFFWSELICNLKFGLHIFWRFAEAGSVLAKETEGRDEANKSELVAVFVQTA